ncbi:protein-L-isoaspartate(D-aspartate) O-methyltransferase [Halomicrobium salinisoli]|uniref:protein-L-isoaspartate(D-aspartate) O-methyltransferase n=1 Tax=Halomicrobium salinisoli TaxID=2878391 RepID=UPI001CF0CB1D|nr:protein-L-isoaspartate(D-aspartate) O-methyltransferase [Halomicrobium salinisoli]
MDDAARREELVERLAERVDDEDVLAAMRAVPRHEFVPENRRSDAYADRPLPIGEGQTISAPHMVAIVADLLDLREGDDVLEVGTGCGYHAAVTAELVGAEHVYTVEYRDSLAEDARERLADLGYEGISVRVGDGKEGWPEHAPFDRAYLTAAAPEFPGPVAEQVRPEGLLLAPIGTGRQRLVRARKRADGELDRESHGAVRFVRLQ